MFMKAFHEDISENHKINFIKINSEKKNKQSMMFIKYFKIFAVYLDILQ